MNVRLRVTFRVSVLLCCLLVGLSPPLAAEDPPPLPARGDTVTETDEGTVVIGPMSKPFDPAPNVGSAVRQGFSIAPGFNGPNSTKTLSSEIGSAFLSGAVQQLFGYDIPDWVFDAFDLLGYNPVTLTLGPAGNVTGYFEVAEVGDGHLEATWPLTVDLTLPAPNSFACGDRITLRPELVSTEGATMSIDPPYNTIDLGVGASDLRVEASLQACTPKVCLLWVPVKGCVWEVGPWCLTDEVPNPKVSSPSRSFSQTLLRMCEAPFDDPSWETLCGCGALNPLYGYQGLLLDVTEDGERIHVEPPPLLNIPEMQGDFERPSAADLTLVSTAGSPVLTRSGIHQDTVNLDLDFVSLLDYVFPTPWPLSATSLEIPGLGGVDLGDITATYVADDVMLFEMTPTFSYLVGLGADMPGEELRPDGTSVESWPAGDDFEIELGNTLALVFPAELSEPVSIGGVYGVDGNLRTLTSQRYSIASELRLLEVGFADYYADSLIDETIFEHEVGSKVIQDATVPFGGNTTFDGGRYWLDPENPIVEIASHGVRETRRLEHGERAVVYRVEVRNGGDVPLLDAHAQLDLEEAFLDAGASEVEAVCLHSADLLTNPDYDGIADLELLADGNTLEVGQTSFVDVLVRVVPAVAELLAGGCFAPVEHATHGHADATSPIGTAVRANWNQCTQESTGSDLVAEVDLGAAVIDSLEDYAVYGFRSLDLSRGMRLSMGNAGTGGILQVLPLRGAPLGDPRIVGDLHVAGDLHIVQGPLTVDYAQVGRRVIAGDPAAELRTTGAASEWSGCVASFPAPDVTLRGSSRGATDVEVVAGETRLLVPGSYGRVEVEGGARLDLAPGGYVFDLLRITGDDAEVLFAPGGGTLALREWQVAPGRGLRLGASDGASRTVVVAYAGNGKLILRDAELTGAFVAPRGAVELREGSELLGSLWARRVLVDEGARFRGHAFGEPLNIGGGCASGL